MNRCGEVKYFLVKYDKKVVWLKIVEVKSIVDVGLKRMNNQKISGLSKDVKCRVTIVCLKILEFKLNKIILKILRYF